ncbi:MAG: penicillin-binding protein [Oscillospiraceae bacterium]|jgi:peptidoglycan glycosyltransferase|nr:penicillin-binding protein [Oscillospiraceae bacterium]
MKLMGRRAWIVLVFCALFSVGIGALLGGYAKDAPRWATYPANRYFYSGGRLIRAGTIYDRNGAALAETVDGQRRYHESADVRRALMHLTGDPGGNVASSLQVAMRDKLTGWSAVTGAYTFPGAGGQDLHTTVDAALCRAAYEALDGRPGAVGIMNYRTGELLCMVSSPTFDPQKPPDLAADPEAYEGVYLNRLLSASFAPGSVFKLVTAAAALDCLPGVGERTFSCDGLLTLEDGRITCPHAHGEQTLGQAMTNSCNVAFAQLALELGETRLTQYAQKAGFGRRGLTLDGIPVSGGSFTLADATQADLGWAGVGQYKTLAVPLDYLLYVSAIANDGRAVTPHILRGAGDGLFGLWTRPGERVLAADTAETLTGLMRDNVLNNYGEGKLAAYRLCAKTGTAEVGGGKAPHAWFVGFLDSAEAPLCFVVLVENGGSGGSVAAGIAKTLLAQAIKLD